MHSLRGMRRLLAGLALATLSIAFIPGSARALPWPGAKDNQLHFGARSVGAIYINRVFMGIVSRGQVGADSSGAGTIQGGYWPRGSVDNYVYGSGLEVAGVIHGVKGATNPWGGDTVDGKFEDPIGTQQHGSEVSKIYNSTIPDDNANWPAYAFVPQGDSSELVFDPLLRGRLSASQGDVEFIAWDGDPAFNSGRQHPVGIMSEYRVMGWNYPSGNQDVVYLIMTLYNISTTNAADYSNVRPSMQAIALQQAATFQTLNNAKFGITLPVGGYTIDSMVAAVANDDDVGNANRNYASVNIPFALKYTYAVDFNKGTVGWRFDPAIFGAPFFAGVGFVGTKILAGPPDGKGVVNLFNSSINGGDPSSGQALYRNLSGVPLTSDGTACSLPGGPLITHICYVRSWTQSPTDIRSYAASPRFNLNAGKVGTFVAAFIFAAPVAIPGFILPPGTGNGIIAGNPDWTEFADSMVAHSLSGSPGANQIDSLTGFLGYTGGPGPHVPVPADFKVLPGSLLGKANVAQQVFDHQFLLPFSPDPPAFFLIPGDKQVTILWKPSAAETTGDPFFAVASSPTSTTNSGCPTPPCVSANALYDPNYRQSDVEGYRVYRGRTDAPSALKLLAQFDYAGTFIKDYGGFFQIGNCAPELGLTAECPVAGMTKVTPGVTSTIFARYDINQAQDPTTGVTNTLIQVDYGNRTGLAAAGQLIVLSADTAITGGGTGFPPLTNSGVPFVFIDKLNATYCATCGTVAPPVNGITYFYAVTAFDFNSFHSGPSSLESPRATKAIMVGAGAGNFDNSNTTQSGVFGRHGLLTDQEPPTIDATTGIFSKKALPANGLTANLAGFATELLQGSGQLSVTYDSTKILSLDATGTTLGIADWFTVVTAAGTSTISVPQSITQTNRTSIVPVSGTFNGAQPIANAKSTFYGGGTGYSIPGVYSVGRVNGYYSGVQGRGCANNSLGNASSRNTQCYYNGPRWFTGANETAPNPTTNSPANQASGLTTVANWGNAGVLPGVATAHAPNAYGVFTGSQERDVDYMLGQFITNADYALYWGAGGTIDSVIDLTHDEPVPFNANYMGASWGVLNSTSVPIAGSFDARAELTASDFTCVAPLRTFQTGQMPACTATAATMTQAAVPGPVAYAGGAVANMKTVAAQPNNGFGLYLKGRIYIFELTGGAVPAAGTVWKCRDYTGAIIGGNGLGGNEGSYLFLPANPRVMTAPGATVGFKFTVNNAIVGYTNDQLDAVHTVPDPYYVTSAFDKTVVSKTISFVKVPTGATIRIYSSSGVLIRVLQNTTSNTVGTVNWDVRNRSNQYVASGVYFYNVQAGTLSKTKRMVIVNFASNVQ